jgi:hypothetical protein
MVGLDPIALTGRFFLFWLRRDVLSYVPAGASL